MSFPNIDEKPTKEEEKYFAECEKEIADFLHKVKEETGCNINEKPGVGVVPRFQFIEPSKWPEYAANVLKLVKDGKRGADLYAALQALELQYPIMI